MDSLRRQQPGEDQPSPLRADLKTAIILAICVTLVAVILVQPATLDAKDPTWVASSDAREYVNMTTHAPASAPFAYRVLVPSAASVLPVDAYVALAIFGYLGAAISIALLYLVARDWGAKPAGAILGTICGAAAPALMGLWFNVALTDAPALAILLGALLTARRGAWWPFLALCVLGAFTRETLVILPAFWWIFQHWRRAAIALAAQVAIFAALRLLVAPSGSAYSPPLDVGNAIRDVLRAWGFVWVLALLGIRFLARRELIVTGVLTTAAIGTAFVATDTIRMLLFLAPAIVSTTARYLDIYTPILGSIIVAASSIQFVGITPTRLVSGNDAWRWDSRATAASLVFSGIVLFLVGVAHDINARRRPRGQTTSRDARGRPRR